MVKDYNSNSSSGSRAFSTVSTESEDEEDPRTPTSVTSSQGYDSAGSDLIDIEGIAAIPDSSLPELSLQVNNGGFAGVVPTTAATTATVIRREVVSGKPAFANSVQGHYAISPAPVVTAAAATAAGQRANVGGVARYSAIVVQKPATADPRKMFALQQ